MPLTLVQNNNLHPMLIVLFLGFFKMVNAHMLTEANIPCPFYTCFQRLEWKLYVRAYTRQSRAIVSIILYIDKPSSGALLFERWYNNINNCIHFIFSRLITHYFDLFMWFINIDMHGIYDSSWSKSPHTTSLSLKF